MKVNDIFWQFVNYQNLADLAFLSSWDCSWWIFKPFPCVLCWHCEIHTRSQSKKCQPYTIMGVSSNQGLLWAATARALSNLYSLCSILYGRRNQCIIWVAGNQRFLEEKTGISLVCHLFSQESNWSVVNVTMQNGETRNGFNLEQNTKRVRWHLWREWSGDVSGLDSSASCVLVIMWETKQPVYTEQVLSKNNVINYSNDRY